MIPFENDNLKAYTLLLRIEIVLRESLRKSLEAEHGAQWQKKLHGELLKKIRKSQADETKPQFDFIRLGPLYYLTFGELLSQLQQHPCRSVAERLGGDCFLKQLENVFTPRNALCHSRPVSSVGLKTIETLYAQMETALTPGGLAQLIAKPDTGLTQDQAAGELVASLKIVIEKLDSLPSSLAIPEAYRTATAQFWWADDTLAGFNLAVVEACFECIKEYNSLPAGVGCAGTRQRYCEQHGMKQRVEDAIAELRKVTQ